MKRFFTLTTLTVLGCILLPSVSAAYSVSSISAERINATTALYSISFNLGQGSNDLRVPILTERDYAGSDTNRISYEVLVDGEDYTAEAMTRGIVASNAQIKDGYYFVPAGSNERFTIYTILNTAETDMEQDYAIHVTQLPFLQGDRTNRYTPQELSHFLTPEIELNNPAESEPTRIITGSNGGGLKISQ